MKFIKKRIQTIFDHKFGVSRDVFLVGKYAFKFASPRYGYKYFLHGLIANIQETNISKPPTPEEFCKVLYTSPGYLFIVMPRATELTDEQFEAINYEKFIKRDGYIVPVENKKDSFGMLNGKIVAIDYGN